MLDPKIQQWYRAYGSEEAKLGKEETGKNFCSLEVISGWLRYSQLRKRTKKSQAEGIAYA